MKSFLYLLLTVFLFVGCGYRPASYYAKTAIEGNVYVDSKIDIDNSEHSVLVKDAINELVLNQFNATLTNNKKDAETFVLVELSSVKHTSISTDDDGYTESYRTTVSIKMSYNKVNEEIKTVRVSDYYDYTVDSDSVITEQKKKVAVKIAATKALTNIFSKIAINSMKTSDK